MMLSLLSILGYGLILSLGLSVVILGSFWLNPRLWMQDFPEAARAKLPPLTREEQRSQKLVAALVLALTFGMLIFSARQLRVEQGGAVTFLIAFAYVYLVFTFFNLFDLVVLDWLILGVIKPKFLTIPGVENMADYYQGFGYHARGFLKGLVIAAVVSAPIALVALV